MNTPITPLPAGKHTPGDWYVAPNGCCVFTDAFETGRGVAMCGMNARTPEEIAANTKLVAASPRLLSVALKFIQGCERGEHVGEVFFSQLLDEARAAIAKAEAGK